MWVSDSSMAETQNSTEAVKRRKRVHELSHSFRVGTKRRQPAWVAHDHDTKNGDKENKNVH